MRFGEVPLDRAEGAILAHSHRISKGRISKGTRLDAGHIAHLRRAGIDHVMAAHLDRGDVDEDEAARQLAAALVPDPQAAGLRITDAAHGRVNLISTGNGVIGLDRNALNDFNRVDPTITLACLREWEQVHDRTLVATIKIISYGVAATTINRAIAGIVGKQAIRRHPPEISTATLVITTQPGHAGDADGAAQDKLVRKGRQAMVARLRALDVSVVETHMVAHRSADIAQTLASAGGKVILIMTAAATSDIDDVAPAALVAAGGQVERFGMPVDPGNLLFLGQLGRRPVIGLPGCARSRAINGTDWVLSRIVCGIRVTSADIAAMGIGGLLKEMPARPQPRLGNQRSHSP